MNSKLLITGLLILISGFAVTQQNNSAQHHPSVKLPPELSRVLTDYENAWQKRDAQALANLFAENGFVLQNGRLPVRGRTAIRQAYEGSGGPLALRAIAYEKEEKIAYIIGGFARAEGEPDIGKFTLTLVKDDNGRWLIMSDMDNPNSRNR